MPPVPPASVVPPEEVKEYRDAQRQLKAATLLVESLTVSLREIEARLGLQGRARDEKQNEMRT